MTFRRINEIPKGSKLELGIYKKKFSATILGKCGSASGTESELESKLTSQRVILYSGLPVCLIELRTARAGFDGGLTREDERSLIS